jgi:hypothetical protein
VGRPIPPSAFVDLALDEIGRYFGALTWLHSLYEEAFCSYLPEIG